MQRASNGLLPVSVQTAVDSGLRTTPCRRSLAHASNCARSANPILLRVAFDAGHGLGSTRSQIDNERAGTFAFTLRRAGRMSVP